MDILSYLSELIQTRKAVGVSGLGTVYKKKLPGRYDAGMHSFVPPSYTIDFTPEVKEEIILAEFISKKRNVSIDTANYFIDEFSTGILQQLNNQQHADFGELGKLYKADDEFRFEPAEKLNYGFDFYGLPVVKADQEPSAEEIMPETPSVEENQSNTEEEVVPAVVPVEEEEDQASVEEISAASEEEALPFETPAVPDQIETPEQEVTLAEEKDEAPAEEIPVIVPVETVVPHMEEPAIPEEKEKTEGVPTTHTEEPVTPAATTAAPAVTPVQEPTIETVVPHQENFIPDSPGQPRKDEKQLRAEIEALNFYRSKSPVAKATITEQEEVIWNIKDNTKANEPAPFYNKNEEIYNPEEEEEQPKGTPLYLKIILGFLILVIMMIVAYMVKPEWFSGILANSPFATPKTEEPIKRPIQERYKSEAITAPADTPKTTVAAPSTAAPAAAKKDSVLKKAVAPTHDAAVVYEIIGASMHDQKEADRFIELMKRSGITAKVVTNMSGKRLKMSIATLKDEESAKLELERLSKKLKIPGIYIYKNKQ
ncbi:hypothetical protein AY601_3304 [Pedobacter cryoconitis]|uniref:CCDC81-like prokaryotic HU domain-containing protein n=1 Tax=Pedobacter cryoconitis TaxID=188932 RepID=A0A127VFR7_9SPHI|nr:hypothetical protein [Pedobacter cryoconitis]AMQ00175.1 hypothetical protein AY601_3304 [Pedobacter cryoconitis]